MLEVVLASQGIRAFMTRRSWCRFASSGRHTRRWLLAYLPGPRNPCRSTDMTDDPSDDLANIAQFERNTDANFCQTGKTWKAGPLYAVFRSKPQRCTAHVRFRSTTPSHDHTIAPDQGSSKTIELQCLNALGLRYLGFRLLGFRV